MKFKLFITLSITAFIITACKSKKSTTSTTPKYAVANTASENAVSIKVEPSSIVLTPIIKSTTGIYPPGNEELTALQAKYKDVTLQTLTQGHKLYTGVCTNCHEAISIYTLREEKWKGIIDDMAFKANITDADKDAVYKYVLSIKATQPK